MGKRKLLYLLLMAFLLPFTASAQKALPYEYGFEDNDLSADGWTMVSCHKSTGIATSAAISGEFGFRFYYTTTPPQYLISPELTGTENGVYVTFSYAAYNVNWGPETFLVGYSTTTADVDAFTWGDETSVEDTDVHEYTASFPAGTKYVAIKCTSNDAFYLFLDDFTFETPPTCIKIKEITSLKMGAKDMTLSFTPGDEEQDAWQVAYATEKGVNFNDLTDVSGYTIVDVYTTSPTITGLTPNTEYAIMLRANCGGGDFSKWIGPYGWFSTASLQPAELAAEPSATSANITWTGYSCNYDLRYAIAPEEDPEAWFMYDDDNFKGNVGLGGGSFRWGIKCPAGSFESITKVAVYDVEAMSGTASIYYGADAPETLVGSVDVSLTGAENMAEFAFESPIEIDPSQDVWVIFNNVSGTAYPAAYSTETSDANGRWVELSGAWYDVQDVGISGAGAWMIRVYTAEEEIDWIETVSTDETSYQIEGLDSETNYIAEVRANCEEDDEISSWARVKFTTLEAEAPVTDLVAENITMTSADIDWTVNGVEEEWNLRYRKIGGTLWDFEDGMGDWTAIDADGDGYTWETDMQFDPHNGSGLVESASYINNVGALTPDNWLISPEVELGGIFSFYAKGQDASDNAENFGVFVCEGSYNESNLERNFVQVDADVTTTNEWKLYTFDLSEFSGNGYIAIRHYDITDMFWLDVDDIRYTAPDEVEDWTVVEGITEHPYTIEDLEEETEYEAQVQSVYGDTTSEWSESVLFTTPLDLIVLDNDYDQPEGETNVDILDAAIGKTVNFTISGRTLYKDGSWNTIALPFILTEEQIEESPLAGATIKTVDPESSIVEGTHVTLNMIDYKDWCEYYEFDYNLLYPSYSYFLMWNGGDDIVDPTFKGVKISTSEMGIWALNEEESIIGVGLFSSIMLQPASELGDDESPIYYMGANNKLKYTGKQRLLNAFRAGFMFESPEAEGALDFTINWGDNDTTTGIVEIEGADSKATSAPTGIYNLQGVKLNQLPKQKGVYINNGKKVIIK